MPTYYVPFLLVDFMQLLSPYPAMHITQAGEWCHHCFCLNEASEIVFSADPWTHWYVTLLWRISNISDMYIQHMKKVDHHAVGWTKQNHKSWGHQQYCWMLNLTILARNSLASEGMCHISGILCVCELYYTIWTKYIKSYQGYCLYGEPMKLRINKTEMPCQI